jgi:hypothetical protein
MVEIARGGGATGMIALRFGRIAAHVTNSVDCLNDVEIRLAGGNGIIRIGRSAHRHIGNLSVRAVGNGCALSLFAALARAQRHSVSLSWVPAQQPDGITVASWNVLRKQ